MAKPRFDWITFDCYGTLIDWERGISDAFTAQAGRKGRTVDRSSVLDVYHAVEPVVEAETYRRYREVLGVAAEQVVERLGWTVRPEGTGFLAESLPSWPPFSDTNPALARLAGGGVKLGILSNVDDDLLAGTRRHFGVPFDLIVTAQQVGSYKPAHGHFTTARARIPAGARWLHAAQSYFHDVVPCKALGIPVAWINRKRQPVGSAGAPDQEFRDLTGLADWVVADS
jgi:2-haloalkanoic acid dehalogenase type II